MKAINWEGVVGQFICDRLGLGGLAAADVVRIGYGEVVWIASRLAKIERRHGREVALEAMANYLVRPELAA
jgi:hypothetical protein